MVEDPFKFKSVVSIIDVNSRRSLKEFQELISIDRPLISHLQCLFFTHPVLFRLVLTALVLGQKGPTLDQEIFVAYNLVENEWIDHGVDTL